MEFQRSKTVTWDQQLGRKEYDRGRIGYNILGCFPLECNPTHVPKIAASSKSFVATLEKPPTPRPTLRGAYAPTPRFRKEVKSPPRTSSWGDETHHSLNFVTG